MEKANKRECGNCTKCCEGYLSGEALGQQFYRGKPCHFIAVGQGCTVYAKRPKDPCVSFKCQWLENSEIPEWFKPNEINAIVKTALINNISYLTVIEAGEILPSKVLSWLFTYAVNNQLNFAWYIDGGINWIGSPEFNQAMSDLPKDKYHHLAPTRLLSVVEVDKTRL